MGSKILVIDDERDLVKAITVRLKANGYEVIPAFDGQEGVDKAIQIKPDLILLDVVMPQLGGYEVCIRLKSNPKTKTIPIIVITASGQQDLDNKCLEWGADMVVKKPFESANLLELIGTLLK